MKFDPVKVVVCLPLLLVLGLIVFGGWRVHREMIDAALPSYVLSVQDRMAKNLRTSPLKESIPLTSDWRELTDDETQLLFQSLGSTHCCDCASLQSIPAGNDENGSSLTLAAKLTNGIPRVSIENFKDVEYIKDAREY